LRGNGSEKTADEIDRPCGKGNPEDVRAPRRPRRGHEMMYRGLGFAALLVSALALGACGTTTNPDAPDQSFDIDRDIQELEDVFKKNGITILSFYATEAENATEDAEKVPATVNKKELRNQFISQRLTLINIQYIKFIRRFAVEKAQLDTAADVLVIGLNLAGTLVGAASTKGILAAISGGTSASRTSINKNFFHEKTVPVLVTAMNAERKEALVPILRGIGRTIDAYPFAQALSDLHIYYQAGTFIGALQAIQRDSGAKEDKADDDIQRLIVGPVAEELQIRRKAAAAFVKTLDPTELDTLATALGKTTGADALVAILTAISRASTAKAFDVIAQQINLLFDKGI